jgi:hypothetical protein
LHFEGRDDNKNGRKEDPDHHSIHATSQDSDTSPMCPIMPLQNGCHAHMSICRELLAGIAAGKPVDSRPNLVASGRTAYCWRLLSILTVAAFEATGAEIHTAVTVCVI